MSILELVLLQLLEALLPVGPRTLDPYETQRVELCLPLGPDTAVQAALLGAHLLPARGCLLLAAPHRGLSGMTKLRPPAGDGGLLEPLPGAPRVQSVSIRRIGVALLRVELHEGLVLDLPAVLVKLVRRLALPLEPVIVEHQKPLDGEDRGRCGHRGGVDAGLCRGAAVRSGELVEDLLVTPHLGDPLAKLDLRRTTGAARHGGNGRIHGQLIGRGHPPLQVLVQAKVEEKLLPRPSRNLPARRPLVVRFPVAGDVAIMRSFSFRSWFLCRHCCHFRFGPPLNCRRGNCFSGRIRRGQRWRLHLHLLAESRPRRRWHRVD
mmetsp:Transcript_19514/g.44048  ORF Transcript_19514/g.44048 Transcript_19514/m.44048 type:complete len:320 (+) Transcript_19514:445-1404(+)